MDQPAFNGSLAGIEQHLIQMNTAKDHIIFVAIALSIISTRNAEYTGKKAHAHDTLWDRVNVIAVDSVYLFRL